MLVNKKFQKSIFLFFILISLFFLVLINLPKEQEVAELNISDNQNVPYKLTVSVPKRVWFGDTEIITINFSPDNSSKSNPDENERINLEVDIVMNGAELKPPGIMVTPIIEGRPLKLKWSLRPYFNQTVRGSIWIYIVSNSTTNNNEPQKKLIYTKEEIIKVDKIFGLQKNALQWFLISLIILFLYLIFRALKKDAAKK